MDRHEIEALYMTTEETASFLGVSKSRVRALEAANQIIKLKGSVYERASVEAYKAKRGDKKAGRYPKQT
ncbi:MAG: helix-turn-helix domain-containing protein [Coriobacteriales bacterium]|jgi:hypothetical protein|nr:helix-turn-helix domain-containing protein [Coriobacteriales bacterium]